MTLGSDLFLLPHQTSDGFLNMATDEAMLDHVASHPERPLFRTYQWSKPTLSLGYFQSIQQAEEESRWDGVPTVRRLTGGGALWHDVELTYALVLPRNHPLSSRAADLYRIVHDGIVNILEAEGLISRRRGAAEARPPSESKPFLCFNDRDANDLVMDGHKVVGSAQRRRAGAVLQHGSILIKTSTRTPELPGIQELTKQDRPILEWNALIEANLPTALGFIGRPEPWPTSLLEEAERLEAAVYRTDAWNRRR